MEGLIVEFMQLFGVSRPLAILKMFELMCLFIAAPMLIFVTVRVGFHAMHFDVLKDDVRDAKKHAAMSATQADKAVKLSYDIMASASARTAAHRDKADQVCDDQS